MCAYSEPLKQRDEDEHGFRGPLSSSCACGLDVNISFSSERSIDRGLKDGSESMDVFKGDSIVSPSNLDIVSRRLSSLWDDWSATNC